MSLIRLTVDYQSEMAEYFHRALEFSRSSNKIKYASDFWSILVSIFKSKYKNQQSIFDY